MIKIKNFWLCIILVMLSSCFNNKSEVGEVEQVKVLSQINGTYENYSKQSNSYLSDKVFGVNTVTASSVTYINIKVINNSDIQVRALDSTGNVIKTVVYKNGQDFTFGENEIVVSSNVTTSGDGGILSVEKNKKSFLLNSDGDALSLHYSSGVGVYGFIPMGGSSYHYSKYHRVR